MRKLYHGLAALAAIALAVGYNANVKAQTPPTSEPTQLINQLVCGDASVCPNQRGTSFAAIAATPTMTLDYWTAVGGASSSIAVAVTAPPSTVQGVNAVMKFQRTAANTNTAVLNLGQVLDTDASTFLQGKMACFSFTSWKGADFSPQLAAFTYTVTWGTGTAQGYASMVAGTWTGTGTVMTGTVTASTLPQPTTQCALVPGTATEIGINFSWTPVGTAGTNDFISLGQIQLAAVNQPNVGPAVAPPFAYRGKGEELQLALRRAWVLTEPAASISVGASGQGASTTTCILSIPFPAPMRAAPTFTAAGTALSVATWTATHVVTNTALATPFLAATTGGHTTYVGNLTATVAAGLTAGQTCTLTGAGGGSLLVFSADLT